MVVHFLVKVCDCYLLITVDCGLSPSISTSWLSIAGLLYLAWWLFIAGLPCMVVVYLLIILHGGCLYPDYLVWWLSIS